MNNLKIKAVLLSSALFFLLLSSANSAFAATYLYDKNGNMTSDGVTCYTYNEANQLTTAKECSSGKTIAQYVYDFQGNRIVKKEFVGGILKQTVYSPTDEHETKKLASNSAVLKTTYYKANDEMVAKKNPDGSKSYFINDHLGSISLVTNQTAGVIETTVYDPFGEVKAGGTNSKFQYTGQEKDMETKLNYYGARYYNSKLGRFIQADPIIQNIYDPQVLNRYSYVRNNPLKYTDPTGNYLESALDIAFIVVDLNDIKNDRTNVLNYVALAGDVGGLLLPGLTGVGLGIKTIDHAGDIAKIIPKADDIVIDGTKALQGSTTVKGLGNIGGGSGTVNQLLERGESWLGAGYKEIAPGVYRSADNSRQFRMTEKDILEKEVHFEAIGKNGREIIENSHVKIIDP